jgi:hypothetical protein
VTFDISAVLRPLEAAIGTLREQLGRAEQGREAERSRADRAETRADEVSQRADTSDADRHAAIALAEHLPMRRIVPHRKLSFFFIFNDINDFINRNF